jgi:hypothetical protein
MGNVLRRAAIYALILAPLVTLHLQYIPHGGPFSVDGSFYMQAARSVAEENRLMTHVSLSTDGLSPFPAPWNSKPLWPIVLGLFAKVFGLFGAAMALPQIFYVIDLLLFAAVANRVNARLGGGAAWRIGSDTIEAGHLVVLMIGTSFIFFQSTIFPYNEGLAFALALLSLLVLDRADEWPVLKWSAGAAALAGLSCLARYQMVALPLACAFVLLVTKRLRAFAIYCITATIVVAPWMLYARSLERYRVQIEAVPWEGWVRANSLVGQAGQIVRGLAVAFNPFESQSYFHSFGALMLLIPLALFVRPRLALLPFVLAATGALSTLMLAHLELAGPQPWLFGDRHSLVFVFLILSALIACLARGARGVRIAAVAITIVGVAQGLHAIALCPRPGGGPSGSERQLISWLSARAPRATLLTTNAQILSVYVRNPLQWSECDVAATTTRKMLDKLHIEYVIVYANERGCAFVRGLDDRLTLAARFDDGVNPIYLFAVTSKMASTGVSSTRQMATGFR